MAITQVRAQVDGVWYVLTYDETERCYVGTIPTPDSSATQPGGYYNVTVEAANDTGETATLDGDDLASLRLVVKDITAPTLTLVSPPLGYLTTQTPTIVVDIADDNAGVDTSTVQATADGESLTVSVESITGGYRATMTPTWADGAHTLEITAADNDGNVGSLSLLYTVDTTPPTLAVYWHRLIVDTATVEIRGGAWDSAGAAISVSSGTWTENTGPDSTGAWNMTVPLEIGVNTITVTATDGAGLTSTWTGTVIRLITDRTAEDLTALRDLLETPMEDWTAEQLAEFNEIRDRGAYNLTDLNRVGEAIALLTASLNGQGFALNTNPKTDWMESDIPTETPMGRYLGDVTALYSARATMESVTLPENMSDLTIPGANAIELALVLVDAVTPLARKSYIYSGEAFSGEF